MSLHQFLDDVIVEARKLLTHTDPAVPAIAQSIVQRAEAAKDALVADAEGLAREADADAKQVFADGENALRPVAAEAVADVKNLGGEAGGDLARAAKTATGTAAPAK